MQGRALAVAVLSAALASPALAFAQDAEVPPAAAGAADSAARGDYLIGSGDVLSIEVYDEAQLTGSFTVDAAGAIVYPLLGPVAVGGKSVVDVKSLLTGLLEKDYLYDPKVDVHVEEYRSKKVRILGNVGRPGIYYLDSPMRLFDLLSRADGGSPRLGEIRRGQLVRVVRQTGDRGDAVERIYIDLYDLLVLGKEEYNVPLADGDVIYIPEGDVVHVVGEVKTTGSFPYEEGMTVLKAITLAGGATAKASLKNTVIKRIEDGKEIKVKAKMEDRVEADDIIEIPLSFW